MVCPSDDTVSRRPRIHHRDHWRAYSTCWIRYDCLNIEAVTWLTEFRTVHLPSQSPGSWCSPLRVSAWTFNCIIIIPVRKVHIVKEGNILRCYNLQYTLEPFHWHIYNKFKETVLNLLIMFLMMTVIVRFHGIIR